MGVQPDPCRAARPAILDKAIILSSSGAEISVAQFTDRGTHFEQRLLPVCDPAGGNKTNDRPCGLVGILMSRLTLTFLPNPGISHPELTRARRYVLSLQLISHSL